MTIKKDILTINFTPDGMKEVRGIVMHSMWGYYRGSIDWFKNPSSKASAHYLISAEGEITQMVLEKDMAWHAGVIDDVAPDWVLPNPNWFTIGIELEDKRDANWQYPVKQREAAKWLVEQVRKRHGIPVDKIMMHRQLNPSRRSDPVGNYALEWLIDAVVPDDSQDVKTALQLLEAFRVEEGHGNLEGAMRDLLGAHGDLKKCKKELENCQTACNERVKVVVESVKTERNEYWQSQMDIAKQELAECVATKCEDMKWKQHLILAIRKFPN